MFILKLVKINIEREELIHIHFNLISELIIAIILRQIIARIHTLIRKIVFYDIVYKSNIKYFLNIFILNG